MFTLWSELWDDVGIVSYGDKTETLIGVMSSRNAVRDLCSKESAEYKSYSDTNTKIPRH